MRGLSFWRPWPWVIFNGAKWVENRGHEVTYRGRFLIHAAKKFDHDAVPFIERVLTAHGYRPPLMLPSAHPEGAIIGVATIDDCYTIERVHELEAQDDNDEYWAQMAHWAFGPWCWILSDVHEFAKPIPFKGKQGWFNVPDELVAAELGAIA